MLKSLWAKNPSPVQYADQNQNPFSKLLKQSVECCLTCFAKFFVSSTYSTTSLEAKLFFTLFSQSPAETFGSATTPSPVKHHLQRVRLWPGHPFTQVKLAPTLPTFGNAVKKPYGWIWLPSNIVTQHRSHPRNVALHVRKVFLNLIRNALKFLPPFWWKPWGNALGIVDSSQELLRLILQSLWKHQQGMLCQKLVRHVLADTAEHVQKFFTTFKSSWNTFFCFQFFTRRKSCKTIPNGSKSFVCFSKPVSYKTNQNKYMRNTVSRCLESFYLSFPLPSRGRKVKDCGIFFFSNPAFGLRSL